MYYTRADPGFVCRGGGGMWVPVDRIFFPILELNIRKMNKIMCVL